MLIDEQNSDDHLRDQFKQRWVRLPSTRLTEQFRINSQKYRGIIENAINADKVIIVINILISIAVSIILSYNDSYKLNYNLFYHYFLLLFSPLPKSSHLQQ